MKKLCLACIAALAVIGIGCGRGPAQRTDGRLTVIYYSWDDPSIRPMIDGFNESQNEIFVQATYLPSTDYETKITTMLIGRTPMDAYMQKRTTDMFPHFRNGFIAPLDDFLANTDLDQTAVQAYRNSLIVDGKVAGFPWRGAAYYTYFNKKIFADRGISTPDTFVQDGTWTWEQFASLAGQVSSGDGSLYGASVYHWGSSQLIMQCQQQMSVLNADGKMDYDESIHRWLSIRKRMEENASMWPLINMKVSATHYSKQFYDGQTAMLLMGEWFPGQLLTGRDQNILVGWEWNDWGLTRIPCDAEPYVTMGAPTFSHITSYSKNKEAAFTFIAWMGGPEGAKIAARSGVLPAMVNEEVKAVLSESIPDPQSLEYFVEDKIVFPMTYNQFGSRVEGLISLIQEEYLLGTLSDEQFDGRLRTGLEEIVRTSN